MSRFQIEQLFQEANITYNSTH